MEYDERIRASGPLKWLFLALAAGVGIIGWVSGILGLADSSLEPLEKSLLVFFLCVVTGTVVAGWLATASVRVKVDESTVSVSLWPLPKTTVNRSAITEVVEVSINPLMDYGGWGIKGKSSDRLYGMSGDSGILIKHSSGQVTILTEQPNQLLQALGQESPEPNRR